MACNFTKKPYQVFSYQSFQNESSGFHVMRVLGLQGLNLVQVKEHCEDKHRQTNYCIIKKNNNNQKKIRKQKVQIKII